MSESEEECGTNQTAEIIVKEKRCSKCKNLCKGHQGPYGKDCKMTELAAQELPHAVTSDIKTANVLDQLVEQMAKMNMTMQAMIQNQEMLQTQILKPDKKLSMQANSVFIVQWSVWSENRPTHRHRR